MYNGEHCYILEPMSLREQLRALAHTYLIRIRAEENWQNIELLLEEHQEQHVALAKKLG